MSFPVPSENTCFFTTVSKTTELWASAMTLTKSPDLSEPQSPIQNGETGTILSACYGREMRLYRKSARHPT